MVSSGLLSLPDHARAQSTVISAEGVVLTIDYGNGTVETLTNLTGPSVLNITMDIARVDVDWYGNLAFVTAINDVYNNATSNRWWQYWVNGEYANVAANQYQLSDGDKVEWRYDTPVLSSTHAATVDPGIVIGAVALALVGVLSLIILYSRGVKK